MESVSIEKRNIKTIDYNLKSLKIYKGDETVFN